MSLAPVDVLIVVSFDVTDPTKTCIFTNARTEALEELLSNWLQDQIGRGSDGKPAMERDVYTIEIGLFLDDDSFCTASDTGNKGLTAGIMMEVMRDLKTIPVKALAERPKPENKP